MIKFHESSRFWEATDVLFTLRNHTIVLTQSAARSQDHMTQSYTQVQYLMQASIVRSSGGVFPCGRISIAIKVLIFMRMLFILLFDLTEQAPSSSMMPKGVFRTNVCMRCVPLKILNCVTYMLTAMQTDHTYIPKFTRAKIMLKSCFLAANICRQSNFLFLHVHFCQCTLTYPPLKISLQWLSLSQISEVCAFLLSKSWWVSQQRHREGNQGTVSIQRPSFPAMPHKHSSQVWGLPC